MSLFQSSDSRDHPGDAPIQRRRAWPSHLDDLSAITTHKMDAVSLCMQVPIRRLPWLVMGAGESSSVRSQSHLSLNTQSPRESSRSEQNSMLVTHETTHAVVRPSLHHRQ